MSHTKHNHIAHIREKLQNEVDLILENIDDSTLFAEFREDEIMDLRNAQDFEVTRNTLDERIMTRYNQERAAIVARNNIRVNTPQSGGIITHLFYFLFKRLEY